MQKAASRTWQRPVLDSTRSYVWNGKVMAIEATPLKKKIQGRKCGPPCHDRHCVLAPIATLGCGKTTLTVALTNLFPTWAHIQNNDIPSRKGKPQTFASAVSTLLAANPVVFADRKNHVKRERRQLFQDVLKSLPEARFVALHYDHYPEGRGGGGSAIPIRRIAKAARERVFRRGDNYQTVLAGSKRRGKIVAIMSGFIKRFEPVKPDEEPDSGFDHVIHLDPEAESRVNLEKVVESLKEMYPKLLEVPNKERMDEAVDAALGYHPPDRRPRTKS
ncbi:tRNA ligase [Rhizina undulata]